MGHLGRPSSLLMRWEKMTLTERKKSGLGRLLTKLSAVTLHGSATKKKRRAKKRVKKRKNLLSKTKFGRNVLAVVRELRKNVHDLPTTVDTLVDIHRVITGYHRRVKQEVGEQAQEQLIPDTIEISMLWRQLLKLQDTLKKHSLSIDVEFAPFIVYGRCKKDRTRKGKRLRRWEILDEFDFLSLKSMSSFVKWAEGRRKRVITLYLNLKRDHIMALMFKPAGCCETGNTTHVGLHKFDPNAANKSPFDNLAKMKFFPHQSFYTNTTRVQGFQDFTCFFWCMHWIMWKMTSSARFALERERSMDEVSQIEQYLPTMLDSFRSTAFKKWATHIHSYICATKAQTESPTTLAMFLLSDAEWLHSRC